MNRLTTYALDLHRPVPSVRETGTLSTGRSVQACTVAVLSMCVLLLAACTDGSISSRSVARRWLQKSLWYGRHDYLLPTM